MKLVNNGLANGVTTIRDVSGGAEVRLDIDCFRFMGYNSVDLNLGCNSRRECFDVSAAQGCCRRVEDTALEWHGRRGTTTSTTAGG